MISPDTAELENEVIRKALSQATQPLTCKQLRDRLTGPYKLSEDILTARLTAEIAAGRVYTFAATGRGQALRYWTRSAEELARETLLRYLAQRPHTRAELLRKAKSTLAGFSEERQKQLLAQLVREEHVQELPPLLGGRTKFYSAKPANPRDYLEDALKKLGKKLACSREDILRAAGLLNDAPAAVPQNSANESLLTRMVQIKLAAAQGGLVPLNELWHSLRTEGWDKTSFDRAVLHLAESYRVALQRHNFPNSLSEAERAELVADQLGNYYVGISLR